MTLDGLRLEYTVAAADSTMWLAGDGGAAVLEEVREAAGPRRRRAQRRRGIDQPDARGDRRGQRRRRRRRSQAGTVVVTVEAMKMEHALTAPVDGVVELLVAVGDQVKVGQPLARITANTNELPEAEENAHD